MIEYCPQCGDLLTTRHGFPCTELPKSTMPKPDAAAVRAVTKLGHPSVVVRQRHAEIVSEEYRPLTQMARELLVGLEQMLPGDDSATVWLTKQQTELRTALGLVVGEEPK